MTSRLCQRVSGNETLSVKCRCYRRRNKFLDVSIHRETPLVEQIAGVAALLSPLVVGGGRNGGDVISGKNYGRECLYLIGEDE